MLPTNNCSLAVLWSPPIAGAEKKATSLVQFMIEYYDYIFEGKETALPIQDNTSGQSVEIHEIPRVAGAPNSKQQFSKKLRREKPQEIRLPQSYSPTNEVQGDARVITMLVKKGQTDFGRRVTVEASNIQQLKARICEVTNLPSTSVLVYYGAPCFVLLISRRCRI